jgi:hypothetical protein
MTVRIMAIMCVMNTQKTPRLNSLLRRLPEGFIADSAWLQEQGLSRSSIRDYAARGWLEQVAPRIYRRPLGAADAPLRWDIVVLSLQEVMGRSLHLGGRTALTLAGFAHYLEPAGPQTIHLYGDAPPWLGRLSATARFAVHASRLFGTSAIGVEGRHYDLRSGQSGETSPGTERTAPWDWVLVMATPERAILEMMDELPHHETFEHVDAVMQGLATLRPGVLVKLLQECRSVKVKRLFLWYADRHKHAWRKHLSLASVDLGAGKRQLVPGGRFDPHYRITLPEAMFGDNHAN